MKNVIPLLTTNTLASVQLILFLMIITAQTSEDNKCLCNAVLIGDGFCDQQCNNEGCAYDFGDCGYTAETDFQQLESDKKLFEKSRQNLIMFYQYNHDLDDNKNKVPANTGIAFASIGTYLIFFFIFICQWNRKKNKVEDQAYNKAKLNELEKSDVTSRE